MILGTMTTSDTRTWAVLTREFAATDHDANLIMGVVIDVSTSAIVAMAAEEADHVARRHALSHARLSPMADVPHPERIVCFENGADALRAEAAVSWPGCPVEDVADATLLRSMEDAVDSLIGKMLGRRQPDQQPSPDDWRAFTECAARYRQTEPWKRWTVADQLSLFVWLDDVMARFLVVITGDGDTQHGFMLYPGGAIPSGLYDPEHDGMQPMPEGTLMFYLDSDGDVPPEFAAKARRYGWTSAETPIAIHGGPGDIADVSATELRHVVLALEAVLAHDAPRLPAADRAGTTFGQMIFADGVTGDYSIS